MGDRRATSSGDGAEQFTDDGWFRTGDVAIGSPDGYFVIADRTKDLIKSGGEWISSVDMEAAIMAMPGVRRGGGDRRARPEVAGAPAGLRRGRDRAPTSTLDDGARPPRGRPASPAGSCPTASSSSTRSPSTERRQVRQEGPTRPVRIVSATVEPPARWDEAETCFLEVSGIRVRVRVMGSGPPLALLMGIGANLDMWQPLVPSLGTRELVAFDAPGTGGSSAARWPMSMAQHAALAGKVLDRLGFDRCDVLGVSWGGLLAQKLAIAQPARVRRLVLAATLPGVGLGTGEPFGHAHPADAQALLLAASTSPRVAPALYGGRARTHPETLTREMHHRLARPPSPAGYLAQWSRPGPTAATPCSTVSRRRWSSLATTTRSCPS